MLNSLHAGQFCMLFCHLWIFFFFFFQTVFFKINLSGISSVSNSLDPDQDLGLDLGPKCLQRFIADD